MVDYEIIGLASFGLAYLASRIYLGRREKKTINNFGIWVDNDFKLMVRELQEAGSELRVVANKLERKLTN